MILKVLEALETAVFHQQLFNTLTHYYDEVQSRSCASGRPKPKHFHSTMNVAVMDDGGGGSLARTAASADGDYCEEQLPPAAAGSSSNAATPATPPPCQARGAGKRE